jgi:HPt (histidine-containing phosphotransfer) domain-containing protein
MMMSNEPLSTHAAASTATGLDAEALARLRELDPKGENKLLERVLRAFQTSAARLMPQLETARLANDRATVRLVAHTLKSSSASIGALELSQVCAQVEALIRAESADNLDPLLRTLRHALDAALKAIQRLLDGPA